MKDAGKLYQKWLTQYCEHISGYKYRIKSNGSIIDSHGASRDHYMFQQGVKMAFIELMGSEQTKEV